MSPGIETEGESLVRPEGMDLFTSQMRAGEWNFKDKTERHWHKTVAEKGEKGEASRIDEVIVTQSLNLDLAI